MLLKVMIIHMGGAGSMNGGPLKYKCRYAKVCYYRDPKFQKGPLIFSKPPYEL